VVDNKRAELEKWKKQNMGKATVLAQAIFLHFCQIKNDMEID
jgi:hypothetical protein